MPWITAPAVAIDDAAAPAPVPREAAQPARRARSDNWLLASAWAALLVPAAMFTVAAVQSHRSAFDQAQAHNGHLVHLANEHALRVLQTSELAFDRIDDELAGASDAQLRVNAEALRGELQRIVQRLPALKSLSVWDADARFVAASEPMPGATTSGAEREFFQLPAASTRPQPHFSLQPDAAEGAGQWLIVSRRRVDAQGHFAGVLAAVVPPSTFFDFYADLGRSERGTSLSLFRADGAVVTRMPRPEQPLLSAPMSGLMMQRIAAGEDAAVLTVVSPVDQERRLIAFRRIAGTPLYIAAARSFEAVLAEWRATLWLLGAFTLPMALTLAAVARIAWRRTRREVAALHELNEEADKRLKAEAALRQSQKLEAMGHLTGGVAHDVNNLLMVVNNNAHLLERMPAGSNLAAPIASIKRAVSAGTHLTRQLLAFSRRQAWHAEVIDLSRWLPSVVDLLRHTLTRDIHISHEVSADVRAVEVDAAELELALINLAINARDAMPQGGTLRIAVANVPAHEQPPGPGPFVQIEVSDSGIGIAPAILERVFEPFFTTKEVGKGTGLGLSQVYGFCTQAGGTARVASRLAKGTTVSMVMRAARSAASEATSPGELSEGTGCVLLVEDNDDVAQATASLLAAVGYQPVRAASTDEALQHLHKGAQRFDVVLSDIVMAGGMDGLEFALALRQSHPDLPVLLMSGYGSRLEAASAAGFRVMAKPCSPQELTRALRRAMRRGVDAATPR